MSIHLRPMLTKLVTYMESEINCGEVARPQKTVIRYKGPKKTYLDDKTCHLRRDKWQDPKKRDKI